MTHMDDWQRLADDVRLRRGDLGLTQEEVAAAGGLSTATLRLIEGAKQPGYRPRVLRDLERGLQWERGSVRSILDGGDPLPAAEDPTLPGIAPAPAEAAPGPDPIAVRIGEAIADELRKIAAGIQGQIDQRRREGVPEPDIFDDPFERNLWRTELTSEYQRVLAIAALRSVRGSRRPNSDTSPPPIELAG